jgi:hypothetical protein
MRGKHPPFFLIMFETTNKDSYYISRIQLKLKKDKGLYTLDCLIVNMLQIFSDNRLEPGECFSSTGLNPYMMTFLMALAN